MEWLLIHDSDSDIDNPLSQEEVLSYLPERRKLLPRKTGAREFTPNPRVTVFLFLKVLSLLFWDNIVTTRRGLGAISLPLVSIFPPIKKRSYLSRTSPRWFYNFIALPLSIHINPLGDHHNDHPRPCILNDFLHYHFF